MSEGKGRRKESLAGSVLSAEPYMGLDSTMLGS